jgi:hypothetical protein
MTEPDPIRVGVVRPDRPAPPIAEAEARVIRSELTRRLGTVVCDLRIDGAPLGEWTTRATAAWPADIDVEIDSNLLWGDGLPPLTALFGRTVDPTAADVRGRMLEHLGLGGRPLDDDVLDADIPWRPTDLRLLARRDGDAAGSSFELAAMASDGEEAARLDTAFDDAVATIRERLPADRLDDQIARLRARVVDLENLLRATVDAADRERSEVIARLDQLAALNDVLQEQAERALLDTADR